MELSAPLAYAADPRQAADDAAALESAGLDAVWVAEAYGFDSPTIMGYLAARTERMKIGAAILNVYSRTPALIAQTAAGLDAVSGGRAVIGLGASGPQVVEGWHGKAYDKPLGRTRETIELTRRILRREVIDHHGITDMPLPPEKGGRLGKPLKILSRPVRPEVPLYVASLGPANVRMTAEIADGWLPTLFIPEKAHQVWGTPLAEGAAKRAPELGPLQVVAGGLLAIGEDAAAARDLARPNIALYVGGMGAVGKNFYNDLAVAYGYEKEAKLIQELYLSGKKKEAEAAVPDEFCELMSLCGPESYVRERVEAFRAAGVTMLNVIPVGPEPARLVETVKNWL
ncbi:MULTISPECIES: LLM class F420-dependent oxidoreductase [unclassified Streptomyces]|uniref:LLM class F420-dependent oxidoreductase n=1 Tax=unclassified Streptomyces TaxID=2593676 RepID=UPI002252D879|nr:MULTISPECIES: LLM class F420-dependent oxidoreductase [unclassified Streptomyces]MCX5440800.1 LLM class F420-dependent oxidoreductase [Streptomyces sp. NBC_00063]WSE18269.1 LLM class F420-dependent oxidoreductase [Streptomyces sp. NBC_01397]